VTRWFMCSLSVAGPFVCRCLTSPTLLPFPHPAHRTGRADLRIRLSEKVSRCRPRETIRPHGKADEAQHSVQEGFGKTSLPRPDHFVLGTEPLTQPFASVTIHRSVGFADWPETKVVGPTRSSRG
jgi:hypothetical protein